MLSHLVKLALRRQYREGGFSILSIGGLVLGFTSVLLLVFYIKHEYSYDLFHKDSDRIYRITSTYKSGDYETNFAINEGYWDVQIEEKIPGVEASTMFFSNMNEAAFRVENNVLLAKKGLYVDRDFLRVFSFPMFYGDPETALNDPSSIVLSRELAESLWGTANVVGLTVQLLTSEGHVNYMVSAVMDRIPMNSSIQFDYLVPGSGNFWERASTTRSVGNTMYIFFKLKHPIPTEELQGLIDNNLDTSYCGQSIHPSSERSTHSRHVP